MGRVRIYDVYSMETTRAFFQGIEFHMEWQTREEKNIRNVIESFFLLLYCHVIISESLVKRNAPLYHADDSNVF